MMFVVFLACSVVLATSAPVVGWSSRYDGAGCSSGGYPNSVMAFYEVCSDSGEGYFTSSCDSTNGLNLETYYDPMCSLNHSSIFINSISCAFIGGDTYEEGVCGQEPPIDFFCNEIGMYASLYDCYDDNPLIIQYTDLGDCYAVDAGFTLFARLELDFMRGNFAITERFYNDSNCIYEDVEGVPNEFSEMCTQLGSYYTRVRQAECQYYCSGCSEYDCVGYETCQATGGASSNMILLMYGSHSYLYDSADTTCSGAPTTAIDNSRMYSHGCINMDEFLPQDKRRIINQYYYYEDPEYYIDSGPASIRFSCSEVTGNITITMFEESDCTGFSAPMSIPMPRCFPIENDDFGYYEQNVMFYMSSFCERDETVDFTQYVEFLQFQDVGTGVDCDDTYLASPTRYSILEDACVMGLFVGPGRSMKATCSSNSATIETWDVNGDCSGAPTSTQVIQRECSAFNPYGDPYYNNYYYYYETSTGMQMKLSACSEEYCSECAHGTCIANEVCECETGWTGIGCNTQAEDPMEFFDLSLLGKHVGFFSLSDLECEGEAMVILDNSNLYGGCFNLEDFLPDVARRKAFARRYLKQSEDVGSLEFECNGAAGKLLYTAYAENDCKGASEEFEKEIPDCAHQEGAPMRMTVSCSPKTFTKSHYATMRMYMFNDASLPCNEEFVMSGINMGLLKNKCIPGFVGGYQDSTKVSCAGDTATFKQYYNSLTCQGPYKGQDVEMDTCTDVGELLAGVEVEEPTFGKMVSCSFVKGSNSIKVAVSVMLLLLLISLFE